MRISRDNPLALGSASPRRRDLLEAAGIPLQVCAATVDERERDAETPEAYLERIVRAKLDAVRALDWGPCPAVLVADTVVVAPSGAVLHKPSDDAEALSALDGLAGATHSVMTRFSLAQRGPETPAAHSETVTTWVTFRPLSPAEARDYAASGEGRDKAGGYAIQGGAASFVKEIRGSFTNVVGLPVCEVVVALRALGWLC